jgi:hypothetical protein
MSRNRFKSEEVVVKLDDGETLTVKVPSFGEFEAAMSSLTGAKKDDIMATTKATFDFLKGILIGWSFKAEDGEAIPCDEVNIKRLSLKELGEIMQAITTAFVPEKKSETQSDQ